MPVQEQQLEQAKSLIHNTKILSTIEKAEWLQLLSEMSERQVGDLVRILSGGLAAHPQQHPPVPLRPLSELVNPRQKEISTSMPEFELDLPGPAAQHAQPKPVQPAAAPNATQPAQHLQQPAPKQAAPQPQIHSQSQPVQQPKVSAMPPQPPVSPKIISAPPKAAPQKIVLNSPEDFSRLAPSMLHGQDVQAMFIRILSAVTEIAKKTRVLPIIANIEKSPLHTAYIEAGLAMLESQGRTPEQVYEHLANEAKIKNKEYMTKQEFELFTDFRKELDKFYS